MATRRLTIYLMRNEIQDFADALAPDKAADEVAVSPATGLDGIFYRPPQVPRRPSWMAFIEPILAEELGDLRSSSVSGLLLIRVRGRIFALTFGYGRTLLDLSRIEHQFGLKVALNRIDPTQLRSLDTKTFEDMVVTTTTQVSKTAELPTFAIDVTTDILRAATGEPADKAFAKRVSGADALVVNLETEADDLGNLCGRALDAYEDDTYKENFEWIDHLTLVRDSVLTDALNEGLVAELARGVTTATHMALPEPINWEDIDAFKIAGTRDHEYDDLDLDEYLAGLDDTRHELALSVLKSRRVSVRFSRSDKFDSRWTVYQCLVSEQRLDGVLFVLIEGRWFKVSESLVATVDGYVQAIPKPCTELVEAMPGEIEASYNARLAGTAAGLISLDAKVKRPGGAASGIELCDILGSPHLSVGSWMVSPPQQR